MDPPPAAGNGGGEAAVDGGRNRWTQRTGRDSHPAKDRCGMRRGVGDHNQRIPSGRPEDEAVSTQPRRTRAGIGERRSHLESAARSHLDRRTGCIGLQDGHTHDRPLIERKLHLNQMRQPRLRSGDHDPLPGRFVSRSRRWQPQHRPQSVHLDRGVARSQQSTQAGHHRRYRRQVHRRERQFRHGHAGDRHVGQTDVRQCHRRHGHRRHRHGWHRHIGFADARQPAEPFVQPRAARIELVDHLPSVAAIGSRCSGVGGDIRHGQHLHRPRGEGAGPPQPAPFDCLQFDVIGPFAGRQRDIEMNSFIPLQPRLGWRRGGGYLGFGEQQRLCGYWLGIGRGFEPHAQLDRARSGRPLRQERINGHADDLSRAKQRRRAGGMFGTRGEGEAFHSQRISGSRLQGEAVAVPIEWLLTALHQQVGDGCLECRGRPLVPIGNQSDGNPRPAPARDRQFNSITAAAARFVHEDRAANRVDGGGRIDIGTERLPLKIGGWVRLPLSRHEPDRSRPGVGLAAAPRHANADGAFDETGILGIRRSERPTDRHCEHRNPQRRQPTAAAERSRNGLWQWPHHPGMVAGANRCDQAGFIGVKPCFWAVIPA